MFIYSKTIEYVAPVIGQDGNIGERVEQSLVTGSLLHMEGGCQHSQPDFQHAVCGKVMVCTGVMGPQIGTAPIRVLQKQPQKWDSRLRKCKCPEVRDTAKNSVFEVY